MAPPEADDDLIRLAEQAAAGDTEAWQSLLTRVHPRLRRMVAVRLDYRLRPRVDPSDVLQEVYVDAVQLLPAYLTDRKIPFFLWLRLVTGHRLAKIHRFHLGAQSRDAAREIPLHHGGVPEASSAALADQLIGGDASPDQAAARAEVRARVQTALAEMDPIDREALALRHFEQLNSAEVAEVLGISQAAASKRYFRALTRLRAALGDDPIADPDAGG